MKWPWWERGRSRRGLDSNVFSCPSSNQGPQGAGDKKGFQAVHSDLRELLASGPWRCLPNTFPLSEGFKCPSEARGHDRLNCGLSTVLPHPHP